mgnify:CR=1 FL=1
MLEKELDIVEIVRGIRDSAFVAKVLLSKHERALIPYF